MKFVLGAAALFFGALGSTEAVSDSSQTIAYWNTPRAVSDPMPLYCEQSPSKRCRMISTNDTTPIYQQVTAEELSGGQVRARRTQATTTATTFPSPADGATVSASQTTIEFAVDGITTDTARFVVTSADGSQEAAVDKTVVNGVASVNLGGFTVGDWTWTVDGTAKTYSFSVFGTPVRESTRTSSQVDVAVAHYTGGGQITKSTGRMYYTSKGYDYGCSGTVIYDNESGRSLFMTAAHCVWDDIDRNFGSNVLFVPDRDGTNASLISRQCVDDPCGCWTASAGVVDQRWTTNIWPANIPWDYGFYIMDDVGEHHGPSCALTDALDGSVEPFTLEPAANVTGNFMDIFGYPISYNPDIMYCSQTAATRSPGSGVPASNWAGQCALSGGASGGPWIKNFNPSTGTGTIVAVSSWGYSSQPGSGSAMIDGPTARCLVNEARHANFTALAALPAGEEGTIVDCEGRPCVVDGASARKLRGTRTLCEH